MALSIFSKTQIDAITKTVIPAATDDTHTHAVVFGVDEHGAQVVAHFQRDGPDKRWELDADAVVRRTWTHDTQVGAQVALRF